MLNKKGKNLLLLQVIKMGKFATGKIMTILDN